MQINLSKEEFSVAIKIYLESLGFSREDFDVKARLVAGRNGNDGRVEVELSPASEPSMDKVKTVVEPNKALKDYGEVQEEIREEKAAMLVDPRKSSTTEPYEIDVPEINLDEVDEEEF